MIKTLIDLAEKGIMPDFLIRSGIKRMQKERLLWAKSRSVSEVEAHHQNWVDEMKKSSIAYVPEKANEQHYEVPPAFFENALGKHLKYSSGYWPSGIDTLDDSEVDILFQKMLSIFEPEDIVSSFNWKAIQSFKNLFNCNYGIIFDKEEDLFEAQALSNHDEELFFMTHFSLIDSRNFALPKNKLFCGQ